MHEMAFEDALVFEYMLRTEQMAEENTEQSAAMLDAVTTAMDEEHVRLYGRH